MDWQPIETLETPAEDLHALLWCRLHVLAGDREWWTKWKCLRGAWVHWLGSRVNDSPSLSDSWYIPAGNGDCKVDRWEITHWMPLPEPPAA